MTTGRAHIRLAVLFGWLFLAVTAATADAAGLKAVQSGSATIADGASSVTGSLTSVTMGSSFLVFSVRSDSSNPIDGQISGQLTNATTVTFSRLGTLGAVTIQWSVAEFTSGVTVQRGSISSTNASIDIPISAVNTGQSFPLVPFAATA